MSNFKPGLKTRGVARAVATLGGLSLSVFFVPSALAQAAADTVVISATRSAQPASRVLADVSVLEREAIERSGAACVADLLVRMPGVSFARNGGPAGTTSVFVRGGESRHTSVYIDGLRVDSQGTGGAAWESLPVEQIERIEVLRGAASAVYGSDAVAGVVHISTRRGQRQTQASAAFSGGSDDTQQASAAVSGLVGALDYALSASAGRSDGFNARPKVASANPDADGWRRTGVQARAGLEVATGHRVEAALLSSRLKGQYDGFGLGNDDIATHTLQTVGVSWQGRWSAEADTRLQWGQTEATYETRPSYYRTETTLRNLVLQHQQRFGAQQLGLTLERRDDELLNPATSFTPTFGAQRHQNALGLSWRTDLGAHSLQALLRHDDDSDFGGHATGSLAWGVQLTPALKLSASAGTSFRAPTLYQRFSEYGVAGLQPEKGRNLELALRWQQGAQQASATLFRNKVRDFINFGGTGACASPFGCYENAGRATYSGLTLAAATHVAGLALQGSVDFHDPRDDGLDKVLRRRARTLGQFSVDTAWAGWGLGAELQGTGRRFEDAANTQVMGGYVLLNLHAQRALAKGLTLQLRVDNVADKAYETARTYAMAGRSALVGLRWSLQ